MSQLSLNALRSAPVATATDQVFEALYDAIVTFQLPPGTKLSEADVAAQMEVSRQPVRDAFFRLSEHGFLLIRPQRATLITKISEEAVMQAAFVRSALELACLTEAAKNITEDGLAQLDALLDMQAEAVKAKDRARFHEKDDAFHRTLCELAGQGHVWTLIKEHKSHMDRVRYLSLPFNLDVAYREHQAIVSAIRAGDLQASLNQLREHLDRISDIVSQIRKDHGEYFEDLHT